MVSSIRDLATKAAAALDRHIAHRVNRWTRVDDLELPDEPTTEDDAVLRRLVDAVPGLLDSIDALEAENARLREERDALMDARASVLGFADACESWALKPPPGIDAHTVGAHHTVAAVLRAHLGHEGGPVPPTATMDKNVELRNWVERLRRVLAVERGEIEQAPDGWALTRVEDGRRCWSRSDEGVPEFAVCTEVDGFWTWSTGADTMWEIDKGAADTALEAMEAADEALEADDAE